MNEISRNQKSSAESKFHSAATNKLISRNEKYYQQNENRRAAATKRWYIISRNQITTRRNQMSSAETKIASITVNSTNHSRVIIKPYEYNSDQIALITLKLPKIAHTPPQLLSFKNYKHQTSYNQLLWWIYSIETEIKEVDIKKTIKFDLPNLCLQQTSTIFIFLLIAQIEDPSGGTLPCYVENLQ